LHYRHASLEGAYTTDTPFRRDLDEIARLLRLRTLVSIHVDAARQVVRAVSGDPLHIYPDAFAFSRDCYRAPLPGEADVVISNAYPMDVSLTFARSKGMLPLFRAPVHASRVAVAGCPEGMGRHRLFPFTERLPLGTDLVRRLGVTPPQRVPQLVARRAWRKLRALQRRSSGPAVARPPVHVYCTAYRAEQLGQLPAGFIASNDWAAVVERVRSEQQGRSDLRVLVYGCAPLQVLG
jgi:hypothetical protein